VDELNLYGQRLREAREERNLSTRDLGEMLGTSAATISRHENGIHNPQRSFISQAAKTLGVNPAWLMGANVDKHFHGDIPCLQVPILGTIAAGSPILAMENVEGYEWVCMHEHIDFCLKVKGDSMINARIHNGDTVYIRKQADVENGEIAAVLIDSEATLKRVYKLDGSIILRAENPTYRDIIIQKKEARNVKILGKAIFFRGSVK